MSTIKPGPGRHGRAEQVRLIGDLRRRAFDRALAQDDAMRRMSDRLGVYDGLIDDDGIWPSPAPNNKPAPAAGCGGPGGTGPPLVAS